MEKLDAAWMEYAKLQYERTQDENWAKEVGLIVVRNEVETNEAEQQASIEVGSSVVDVHDEFTVSHTF